MDYAHAHPGAIAEAIVQELCKRASSLDVETDGASKAAEMLAELL